MADYGKYALSGPFAALLAEFVVEEQEYTVPTLVHEACGDSLCEVEDSDTLVVLVQAAIDHNCPVLDEEVAP